jgi:YesN/AraC family two-component response regulator
MVMPFMDGAATIRALQRMNAKVRIVAASGLGTGHHADEGALEGVSVFLNKPYTAEKLLKTLAEVLRS